MTSSTLTPERREKRRERDRASDARRKEEIRKQIAKMPPVECECGCGTLIPPLTLSGKPRRFADRHGARSPKFRLGANSLTPLAFPVFDQRPPCADDEDPDIFWDEEFIGVAKSICRGCPVREKCLSWAIDHGEMDGVWGGLSAKERAKLRRAGVAKAPALPKVTPKEKVAAIAHLTKHGATAVQIARRLGLNERTVHRYRERLKEGRAV